MKIPDEENWANGLPVLDPRYVHWYTDDTKIGDGADADINGPGTDALVV